MTPEIRAMMVRGRSLAAGRGALIRSGFWSLALRLSGLVSGFLIGVLLARVLGPTEFGIYGLVTTMAGLGMTVVQLGTPQLAVRELSVRANRADWIGVGTIVRQFAFAVAIASAVIGLLSLVGALALKVSNTELNLVVQCAILTSLTAFTGLLAAELRGLGALLKGQSMDIAVRPLLTFLIVGALLLAGSQMDALLALTIQNAVTLGAVAISVLWLKQVLPVQPHGAEVASPIPWVRAALPLGAVDVLRVFDGSYGVVLVGWISSGADLGVFRVAVACAVLAAMPVTIFHILLAPTVSRLHKSPNKEELQKLLSWTAVAMTAIMLLVAVAAWFLGRPLIALVFGVAYANAWLPLFLLTLAQLIYALFGMGPILLAMCDGERDLIRIYAIAISAAVALAIPMTFRWGGAGAAAGPLVSASLIGWMSRRYARRELGVEITAIGALSS